MIWHITKQVREGKRKTTCPEEVIANIFMDLQPTLCVALVVLVSIYELDLRWFHTIRASRYQAEMNIYLFGGRNLHARPQGTPVTDYVRQQAQ